METEEEQTYEITAVDHVNKQLLAAFKNHLESGNVKTFEEEDDDGEWDDAPGEEITSIQEGTEQVTLTEEQQQ